MPGKSSEIRTGLESFWGERGGGLVTHLLANGGCLGEASAGKRFPTRAAESGIFTRKEPTETWRGKGAIETFIRTFKKGQVKNAEFICRVLFHERKRTLR